MWHNLSLNQVKSPDCTMVFDLNRIIKVVLTEQIGVVFLNINCYFPALRLLDIRCFYNIAAICLRALWLAIFLWKRNGWFIEMVHADVIVGEISCQQKFFSRNFLRVKLNLSCYYWQLLSNIWVRVSRYFEDLENVSEMVAETSDTSKDQQSESATGENNTCTCMCSEKCCQWKQHVHVSVHVQNLQFDQCRESDFSAWKMSCHVIKVMDNVYCASIQFGLHLDSWEST